jgi:hypothetical protein
VKKVDTSQLKGLIQKLGVVRNYSSFILPTALMAVALFLLLVPAPLMSGRLKERMDKESADSGKRIKSLSSKGIVREQWKVEHNYQDALAKDANEIARLARQSSQRELLSYVIFPKPNETSTLIFEDFGRRYRSQLKKLIADLGGRERPTDIELLNSLNKGTSSGNDTGRSFGIDRINIAERFSYNKNNEVERTIVNELCLDVAESASFYVSLADIPGYKYWDTGSIGTGYKYMSIEQSVRTCWFWQIGYWIIEDVLMTMSEMNTSCENVLDCPVKRLISVGFGDGTRSSDRSGAEHIRPYYVMSTGDGIVKSFTKRVSNGKFDVVHFSIVVMVNADDALLLMQELCSAKEHAFKGFSGNEPEQKKFKHNQITILDSSIEPVETDIAEHEFYRYGDDAVVKLEMTCEYIFDVAGYNQIKPESLKNTAGAEEY